MKTFLFGSLLLLSLLLLTTHATAAPQQSFANRLVGDARSQIGVTVGYDAQYRQIAFPMGDVSLRTGVCTDVLIHAYRRQKIDLQQRVHADMKRAWSAYPNIWGLQQPDTNIDHRRVPNLEVFFRRHGKVLSTTDKAAFLAGDIVSWRLPNSNLPHIGIVSDKKASDGTPLIIHNIGCGVREEMSCSPFQLMVISAIDLTANRLPDARHMLQSALV